MQCAKPFLRNQRDGLSFDAAGGRPLWVES
jgi:hypothetical protein